MRLADKGQHTVKVYRHLDYAWSLLGLAPADLFVAALPGLMWLPITQLATESDLPLWPMVPLVCAGITFAVCLQLRQPPGALARLGHRLGQPSKYAALLPERDKRPRTFLTAGAPQAAQAATGPAGANP